MFRLDTELAKYGGKIYSQNNEDGILKYLTEALSIHEGYCVEFGVGPPSKGSLEKDGLQANCRLLSERNWGALFMDGRHYPDKYNVKREFITALNINFLLKKYHCPSNIDVFSIDVDGQDFWIWMNLQACPRILIIEYNRDFEPDDSFVVGFNTSFRWDATRYFGASLFALCKLGESRGYRPVYANGVNVFFVREDLILNAADFPYHLRMPRSTLHKEDPQKRPWTRIG